MMDSREFRTGRPPKDEAEALGDHVVAVADALFIEKGYSDTSMALVAARARVGKQTLYRRFPDKAALFREVIRRRIDATLLAPAGAVTGDDPMARLKALGRGALETVLDPEFIRLYRIIIANAESFPELAAAVTESFGSVFLGRCVETVRQAQAKGLCRSGDPEALVLCFVWSLIGDALLRGLSGLGRPASAADRETQCDTAWRVFQEGVLPPEARTRLSAL